MASLTCGLASATAGHAVAVQSDGDRYRLVWSDEFSADGRPDPAKWNFETGFVRNSEAQWYQRENAVVRGGNLVIEARREAKPNPIFADPKQPAVFRARRNIAYTSASLTTRGIASWQYGRFEIRARISARQGLWPALWFVGASGKWPASGEVDLMEYYDRSVLGNFGWASAQPGKAIWRGAKVPLSEISDDPAWDQRFHTWVMDWDKDRIILTLDGREINRLTLGEVHNPVGAAIDNPFRQPQYLIINLALGGTRGGPLRDTPMPSQFEVDYVRIYQKGAQ